LNLKIDELVGCNAAAVESRHNRVVRGGGESGVTELQRPARPGQSSGAPHRSEDEQRAFFHAALDRTLAAEAKAGSIERCFALADFVVSFKFVGGALTQCFTPALAHLEVPPSRRSDAVFYIWDSESTGTDMLPPPCSHGCFTSRGDIWTMGSQRFKSAYLWSEYALNLFDTLTATGVYWTQAATESLLPYWAKASPLRCLFHWWAETKGCQLVHAAAVGSQDGAVLITGKGGLGKSTTALACLGKGLNYVGDDYVVVQLDPFPRVHSLYCTAKLNWDQMARFPRFADLAKKHDRRGSEKAVMYLYPEMRGQIVRSLPLQAITTPHISNRPKTEFQGISTLALQRAAVFTTMSQLPHANQHTYQFINHLIERLPSLQLVLGCNLDTIADVVVELLRSSGSEIDCFPNRTYSKELISGPLISVIMPVHNGAQLLSESIASVLAQKYPALEIIVVDDGSTDEIDEIVHRLPVDVRFLRQRHAGLAAARNRGIREASGELVAFLDVGCLWPEGYLQIMIDVLSADSGCTVVRGFGQLMKADAEPGGHVGNPGECFPSCLSSAIYRREVFQTVGLFDQELGFGEENEWYERARENGLKLRQVNQVTLIRRHDADTNRGKSVQELKRLRILKNALDRERAEASMRSEDRARSAGGAYIGKPPAQLE
jgi:GT2 family glycosyltransferase